MVKNSAKLENDMKYHFANPEILRQALTRRSYLEEKQVPSDQNMDPLATLGDAVLDLVALQALYENGERDPGNLDQEKQRQIRKERIVDLAEKKEYHEYVRWGKGEEKEKIWNRGLEAYDTSIEALIGAVYLDAQKNRKNGVKAVARMLKWLNFIVEP